MRQGINVYARFTTTGNENVPLTHIREVLARNLSREVLNLPEAFTSVVNPDKSVDHSAECMVLTYEQFKELRKRIAQDVYKGIPTMWLGGSLSY